MTDVKKIVLKEDYTNKHVGITMDGKIVAERFRSIGLRFIEYNSKNQRLEISNIDFSIQNVMIIIKDNDFIIQYL